MDVPVPIPNANDPAAQNLRDRQPVRRAKQQTYLMNRRAAFVRLQALEIANDRFTFGSSLDNADTWMNSRRPQGGSNGRWFDSTDMSSTPNYILQLMGNQVTEEVSAEKLDRIKKSVSSRIFLRTKDEGYGDVREALISQYI